MLLAWVLCARQAIRSGNTPFFIGTVVYGFLLEQVAIVRFDLYAYPLTEYTLSLLQVPLAIAFGWSAVIYAGYVAGRYFDLRGFALAAFTGLFGLSIDLAMDPVAAHIGLWNWFDASGWYGVPPDNFLGWFLVAFVYTLVFTSAGRYRTGGRRVLVSLVGSIPILVGSFHGWLILTNGRYATEVLVLVTLLTGAVFAVAGGEPRSTESPPKGPFYAVAVFHVFVGVVYVLYGLFRPLPSLSLVIVASVITAYLCFHHGPINRIGHGWTLLSSRFRVRS